MSKLGQLGAKLYRGEVSYDFIGKRKLWFIVSIVLIVLSLGGLVVKGLALGIEFKGGADYQANAKVTNDTVDDVTAAVRATNAKELSEPIVTTIGRTRSGSRPSRWTRTTSPRSGRDRRGGRRRQRTRSAPRRSAPPGVSRSRTRRSSR